MEGIKNLLEYIPSILIILAFAGSFREKAKKENEKQRKHEEQKSGVDLFWETVMDADEDTIKIEPKKSKTRETKKNKQKQELQREAVNIIAQNKSNEVKKYQTQVEDNKKRKATEKYYSEKSTNTLKSQNSHVEDFNLEDELSKNVLRGIIMSEILSEPKSKKYFNGPHHNK